jgi:hypothetical protein
MGHFYKKAMGAAVILLSMAAAYSFGEAERKIEFTGYSSWVFGQIVLGTDVFETGQNTPLMSHYWSQEAYAGVGFHAALNERFTVNAAMEGKMWYPFPSVLVGQPAFKRRYYGVWLDQGNATYKVGDVEKPWLTLTMGYFKYKYNTEARNLGEQLFRSLAYPGIIVNSFDFPASHLLGCQAHFDLLQGRLNADAFIISESDWYPFGDISPALVASFKPHKLVEIGGGVEFARLISVNDQATTPRNPGGQMNENVNKIINYLHKDQFGLVDSISYDSAYYTFKATKLMGRVTLDPKALFDLPFFGPEDGKLYGEIDVLGLKNYSFWYEDINKRMPIMFGFNVPTFRVLDVLSMEFENYKSIFSTRYLTNVVQNGLPQPDHTYDTWDPLLFKFDDWKWSVYVKKTVFPGFSITAQFARDHMHATYVDGYPFWGESVARPGQWWWTAKLCYNL